MSKRLPTSEPARRLATICHRKLTTPWSDREIRCFRKLVKAGCFDSDEDIALVEAYCFFERKKGERGLYRRDLYTLIFNWQGEVDRANAWRELHPLKPKPRVIVPMPLLKSEPYVAPTDPEELAALARFEQERLGRKGRLL